jgi:hypothetical protein
LSIKTLHPFGELAVLEINENRKIRNKLENRGRICMYLGPAKNNSTEMGRFLNLETKNCIISRDITWLSKTHGEWKGIPGTHVDCEDDDDDDDVLEISETPTQVPVTPVPPNEVQVEANIVQ